MNAWTRLMTAIANESTSFDELETAANELQALLDAGAEVPNRQLAEQAIAHARDIINCVWSTC
jgi:hypothetical protein